MFHKLLYMLQKLLAPVVIKNSFVKVHAQHGPVTVWEVTIHDLHLNTGSNPEQVSKGPMDRYYATTTSSLFLSL